MNLKVWAIINPETEGVLHDDCVAGVAAIYDTKCQADVAFLTMRNTELTKAMHDHKVATMALRKYGICHPEFHKAAFLREFDNMHRVVKVNLTVEQI